MNNIDFNISCVWVICPWNGRYPSYAGVLLEWSPCTTYKLSHLTQGVPMTVNVWVAYTYTYIFV